MATPKPLRCQGVTRQLFERLDYLGYTSVEVARSLGVHPITVARYRTGVRTPGAHTQRALARLADVEISLVERLPDRN